MSKNYVMVVVGESRRQVGTNKPDHTIRASRHSAQRPSRQHGKHRHTSKNTVTRG